MAATTAIRARSDWQRFGYPFILLALCGALYLWRLGLTPLEDFDEAYYAAGAREMLARGDLGTPHFNGRPFLLKPILIYWLIAAAFSLFGSSEFAARVGSASLGILMVLLTYWFGANTLNPRAGFFAALTLALNYMWIDISRDASIDIPLTVALAPAMFCFYLATQAPPERRKWLYLALYPLVGVALLAKGPVPVGVVACGLLAYLVAARRLRATVMEARLLPGLALMLAVAAPWYLYEAIRQPAFLRTFFVGEHFGHIRGELARTVGIWGNIWYLVIFFYPWVAFIPGALAHALRQTSREHVLRFAAWWAMAVVVLFSIPKSKLAHYLAPAFPPLSLLVGAWLEEWLAGRLTDRAWRALAFAVIAVSALFCTWATMVAAAPPAWLQAKMAARFGLWTPGWSPVVILGVLAGGAWAALMGARFCRPVVVPALAGAMLVAGLVLVGWFNPHRAQIQAQPRKELAQFLSVATVGSDLVGVYHAKRNATVFYLGRPIVDLGERPEEMAGLLRFLSSPSPAVAITHRRFLPELKRSLPRLWVWREEGDYLAVSNRPLGLGPVGRDALRRAPR